MTKPYMMVNVLKFQTLFSFLNKILVFMAGIHKMPVRIANIEDPTSSEAV